MKEWLLLFYVTQINKKRDVVKMSRFLISHNSCFSLGLNKRTKRVFSTIFSGHLSEGLSSAINHVMSDFNLYSRDRGRFIEFRDLHYGYTTVIPNK